MPVKIRRMGTDDGEEWRFDVRVVFPIMPQPSVMIPAACHGVRLLVFEAPSAFVVRPYPGARFPTPVG
jgi:hypothetical protein